jgi:hypothetical protein
MCCAMCLGPCLITFRLPSCCTVSAVNWCVCAWRDCSVLRSAQHTAPPNHSSYVVHCMVPFYFPLLTYRTESISSPRTRVAVRHCLSCRSCTRPCNTRYVCMCVGTSVSLSCATTPHTPHSFARSEHVCLHVCVGRSPADASSGWSEHAQTHHGAEQVRRALYILYTSSFHAVSEKTVQI